MKLNKKVVMLLFLLVLPLIVALTEKEALQLELDSLTAELSGLGYDVNSTFNATSIIIENVSVGDVHSLLFRTEVNSNVSVQLGDEVLFVERPSPELIRKYVSPLITPDVELEFNESVNKTRLEGCGRFGKNLAFINSSFCPELNRSAKIIFNKVPFVENITVLRDGQPCSADVCTNLTVGQRISLSAANSTIAGVDRVSFNVKEFSGYELNGSGGSFKTSITACGNITTNSVLTANIDVAQDAIGTSDACITFRASNIELDCNGFSISIAGTTSTNFGIDGQDQNTLSHGANITIKNCIIHNFGTGIRTGRQNSTIINNTINGTSTGISALANAAIINNSLQNIGGIGIAAGDDNKIINNSINSSRNGIIVNGRDGNNITDNRIIGLGDPNQDDFTFDLKDSIRTIIDRNFIRGSKDIKNAVRIVCMINRCEETVFRHNTVISGGTAYALNVTGANHTRFINNTFSNSTTIVVVAKGTNITFLNNTFSNGTTGIEINDSNEISIINSSFQDTTWGIKSARGSNISLIDNHRITNYSFNTVRPRIRITGFAEVAYLGFITANGTNLSQDINLTVNGSVHVNSSRTSGLNASANITLFNVSGDLNTLVPELDYDDDGLFFEECMPPDCTVLSRSNSEFIFNVSRLSTYQNGSGCGRINVSKTLVENIDAGTSSCFDFNQSNIIFDCGGYNITGGKPSGVITFNITTFTFSNQKFNLSNITIKNCNILNFSIGINVSSAVNITLQNNNITTSTDGIWLNSSIGNILENNSINVSTGTALRLSNSTNNTVGFGNFSTNTAGAPAGHAIHLLSSTYNVLNNNTAISLTTYSIYLQSSSANNVLTDNIGLSENETGIFITGSSNNNLTRNVGRKILTTGEGAGIALISSNNNNLINNTGRGASYSGIYLEASDNNNLTQNRGDGEDAGIKLGDSSALDGSDRNLLVNNTGVATGSRRGFEIERSHHNIFINNNATSSSGIGLFLDNGASNNTFTSNNIFGGSGGGGNDALSMQTSSNNNTFTNNTMTTEGTSFGGGGGINAVNLNGVDRNHFSNNTFKNVNRGGPTVFLGGGSKNNNFTNSTLIGDMGFEINASTNITITNSSFQGTNWSIKAALGSNITLIDNHRITNYSFNTVRPTIRITGLGEVAYYSFITASDTNLSQDINLTVPGRVHVNSSRVAGLNASANITLFSVTGDLNTLVPELDYDDDGVFEECMPPDCIVLSRSNSEFIFNVSRLSTYQNGSGCGRINVSTTLVENIDAGTSSCFDFNLSNLVFNCAGFNITGGTNTVGGIAFNISTFTFSNQKFNLSNITIQNCNVRNFSGGINITAAVNLTLWNNNFTSNMINGIQLNNTANSLLENNSANATTGHGLSLNNASNNTIMTSSVSHNDASTTAYGLFLSGSRNNILINNTGNGASARGIYLLSSSYNNITNSTGRSDTGAGVHLDISSNNTLFGVTGRSNTGAGIDVSGDTFSDLFASNNLLENSNGTTDSFAGIRLFTRANSNQIKNSSGTNWGSDSNGGGISVSSTNNNITSSTGLSGGRGISISNDNNKLTNSSGTSLGPGGDGFTQGILISGSTNDVRGSVGRAINGSGLRVGSSNNIFFNNTFDGRRVVFILESDNINITNTTVIGYIGFVINSSSGNGYVERLRITNTSFQNTNISITARNTSITLVDNERITAYNLTQVNLTVERTGFGIVNFLPTISANNSNFSMDINLTANKVHVNTSRVSGFNVSANVTINTVSGSIDRLVPKVDFNDDGVYEEDCVQPVCTILSRAHATYIFNTSRFSTYKVAEGCGRVNESMTLTENAHAGSASCFDINRSNIVLDCDNFNITGITNGPAGITAINISENLLFNLSNITIKDCLIRGFRIGINITGANETFIYNTNVTNSTAGIWLLNASQSVLENNSMNVSFQVGLRLSNSSNNTLTRNNVSDNCNSCPTEAAGLWLNNSRNNILFNNTGQSRSGSGLYLSLSAFNNLTHNYGTSDNNNAMPNVASANNTYIFNRGTTRGTGANIGFGLTGASDGNIVINNTIEGLGDRAVQVAGSNNVFLNNTINGLFLGARLTANSNNNNFTNSTIVTANISFDIQGSNNVLITNTSFQNTNWSIVTSAGSNVSLIDNERLTNYSFANAPRLTITKTGITSLTFLNIINANGTNLSMDVNLTSNRTLVNTTKIPGFNVTANITLFNLVFNNPQVILSYTESGIFELCNATICREQSYDGNGYKFNVSHFTIFAINETPQIRLFAPANNTWINRTAVFDWSDSFGNPTYILNASNQSNIGVTHLAASVIDSNLSNTTEGLIENITYYWMVTAFDEATNKTNSTINTFRVDRFAPYNITIFAPANGTTGSPDIFFNWTAFDNLNLTLTCHPTIDGVLNISVTTTNNSNGTTATIQNVSSGTHNISITCFDNANANVSGTFLYHTAQINITLPFNSTIARPTNNITINVTEIFDTTFIDQVNVSVNNETVLMSSVGNDNWTATFIIRNDTPRYVNITAVGYNISFGSRRNLTSVRQLRLDRDLNNIAAPSEILACSNHTYTLNNTNVNLRTIYNLDTLPESINLSVKNVSGLVTNVSATAHSVDFANYQVESNYSFIALEEGQYNITSTISTISNHTFNSSFNLYNTKANNTFNLTGANISVITIRDVCGKNTINRSLVSTSLLMPNNSRFDLQIDFEGQPLFNLTPFILNNSNTATPTFINASIDYNKRTNETDPPGGYKRVDFWENNMTNLRYDNFTLRYEYSALEFSIDRENRLRLYRCDNISNCVLSRQNITLDTTANTITAVYTANNMTAARLMLVEPSVSNTSLLQAPVIEEFNVSRKHPNINELVDISAVINFTQAVFNVTLTVNGTVVNVENITTLVTDQKFIYNFNFTPANQGSFPVIINAVDENTLETNATKTFFVNSRANVTLSATGFSTLTLQDRENNATIGTTTNPPLSLEVTTGRYNFRLLGTTKFIVALRNTSVTGTMTAATLEEDFQATIPDRKVHTAFKVKSTSDFEAVDLTFNYSSIKNEAAREQNLQLYRCSDANTVSLNTTAFNCTSWEDTNVTVDVNGSQLIKTFSSLSSFAVAETQTFITENVSRTLVSSGGGGVEAKKKTVAGLSFITPQQALVMHGRDEMTAVFTVRNTGKMTLNDIKLDAHTDTKDLTLRLEKTSIPALAPGESAQVKIFIQSHTDPAVYEIIITATASNVQLVQTSKIFITLQDVSDLVGTEQTLAEIKSANDVLQQNPQCFELGEFLVQAEIALKERKYEKARSLASAAIEGCNELIAYSSELQNPVPIIDLEKFKLFLIIGITLVSVVVVIGGYLLGVGHRHKDEPRKYFKLKAPVRRIPSVSLGRRVLHSKLPWFKGKKREKEITYEEEKAERAEKELGKAPKRPYYAPAGRKKF